MLSPSEFFALSNFFITTSKRKPRQLKEENWRGRGEKLLIFNVGVDVLINRFHPKATDEIRCIFLEERLSFPLGLCSLDNVTKIKRDLGFAIEQGRNHSTLGISKSISSVKGRPALFQKIVNDTIKELLLLVR